MQKITTISILFVLAVFWTYPCQAENVVYFAPDGSQITEAQYDRLVSGKTDTYQRSKKAARSKPLNKRDPKGLVAYLAPSYKVTMKTYEGEFSLTRDEYMTYLEEGWNAFGFYRARQDSEKITITPDKQKATLEANMIEIATLTNGASIKVRTHQKSIFEIVDGKILITSSEAREERL
jgi:hypothetical protein